MAIKDSGERREFPSGAVRDITDNKGRPTLMPLEVVYMLTNDIVIYYIGRFKDEGDTMNLIYALSHFSRKAYDSYETMLLEVSKHYEEGAKKYGDNNWKLGIPVDSYLDSAIRHYLKYRRGDQDENHDRAFVFNIMSCIWEVDVHGSES